MMIIEGSFWQRSRKWLKTGWLIMAGVVALYVGAIEPQQNAREINSQRATGLSAVNWEPTSLWRQVMLVPRREGRSTAGVIGGVPGGLEAGEIGVVRQAAMMTYASPPQNDFADRKMARTSSIDLIVKNPAAVAEKVQQLAEHMRGFLVSSQISGGQDAVPVRRSPSVSQRRALRRRGRRYGNSVFE